MAGGASGIGAGLPLPMIDGGVTETVAPSGAGSFGEVLRGKLDSLAESQATADIASQQIATGDVEDLARNMMQVEQANVSLQLATQLRNKAIEAYQEILRMQI